MPTCKQLDCHHRHSPKAVNPMPYASVPPENEKQCQHTQESSNKKALRSPGTKVCSRHDVAIIKPKPVC